MQDLLNPQSAIEYFECIQGIALTPHNHLTELAALGAKCYKIQTTFSHLLLFSPFRGCVIAFHLGNEQNIHLKS